MNDKYDAICWYHGKISREEAEELLKSDGRKNGLFLVRESKSSMGDYVLSVLYNDQVNHFQIRRHLDDAFFSIDECLKFHGLEVLIQHYMSTPNALPEILILTEYLKGQPPPHDSRRHGRTNLLHRATNQGNYKVVYELLKTDYPHEAKNQDGQTAVHLASMTGKNDILMTLIEFDASVNLRDSAGYTPLHYACQNNFPATVRLLVQTGGANIQARHTESGEVPLHIAANYGHKKVIKELLSLNAPVRPRNKNNLIPSQLARNNNHMDCVEILEKYKCPSPKSSRSKWYHGTLDRHEAEITIRQYSTQPGTFLVRFSERSKENVLSLLSEDYLFNYKISQMDKYLYIDDGPYLDSLEHVVEHYSYFSDGLPTVLRIPVPPKPKPPVPEFSTLPKKKPKKKPAPVNDRTMPKDTMSRIAKPEETIVSPFPNLFFTSDLNVVNNNNNYCENEDDYIPAEKIKKGRLIGEGEFASVYEGTYTKTTGETLKVAIKILHNEQLETNKDAFLSEAQVMMKLHHHCIVKLIGLCLSPQLLMVQELVPLGSLLNYLDTNRERINPDFEFKIWAAQIACGMKYLEEKKFVHRDLAARNILLASQKQAKISDFGLSRALGSGNEYYRAMAGGKWPLKWYAPESYNYGQFSHKSDVWSFGVTIWEMYTFGNIPYGDMKGSEAITLLEAGERLEQPKECPLRIYQIMRNCWEYDAANRPTFTELLDCFTSDLEYANVRELLSEMNLA